MADYQDAAIAGAAVRDASTSAQDLMTIAFTHPRLGADVARHPNAYPGLLDWLRQYGTPDAKQAAARSLPEPASAPPKPEPPSRVTPQPDAPGVDHTIANNPSDVPSGDDKPGALQMLQTEIDSWPGVFSDLVEGADTTRWRNQAAHEFAPPLLFGQSANGISLGAVVPADASVMMAFPVFVDDDPLPISQAGQQAKFNGKARAGMVVITEQACCLAHEMTGASPLKMAWGCPLADVKALNELQFKFSMLSMTSSGPGYELLVEQDGKPDRIVFRVALQPTRYADFESRLRAALGLPAVPAIVPTALAAPATPASPEQQLAEQLLGPSAPASPTGAPPIVPSLMQPATSAPSAAPSVNRTPGLLLIGAAVAVFIVCSIIQAACGSSMFSGSYYHTSVVADVLINVTFYPGWIATIALLLRGIGALITAPKS